MPRPFSSGCSSLPPPPSDSRSNYSPPTFLVRVPLPPSCSAVHLGAGRRGEEGEGGLGKRFFFAFAGEPSCLPTHARDPSERSPEKEDTTPEGHLYYWRASTAYCVLRTRSCVQYAVLDLLLLACSSCVFVFFGRILLLPVPDLCCAAGLAGRLPVRLPRG